MNDKVLALLKGVANGAIDSAKEFIIEAGKPPPTTVMIIGPGKYKEVVNVEEVIKELRFTEKMLRTAIQEFCRIKQTTAIISIDKGTMFGLQFEKPLNFEKMEEVIEDVVKNFNVEDLPKYNTVLVSAIEKHGTTYKRALMYEKDDKGEYSFTEGGLNPEDAIMSRMSVFKPWAE